MPPGSGVPQRHEAMKPEGEIPSIALGRQALAPNEMRLTHRNTRQQVNLDTHG
jgi:hypothetical protein